MAVCYEAKERKIDARPRAPKNRSRIRWNTLRIFQGREQGRYLAIVRLSRKVSVGQAPTAASLPIPCRKKMCMWNFYMVTNDWLNTLQKFCTTGAIPFLEFSFKAL